jgi:uncharacterized protein (DUF433 family)
VLLKVVRELLHDVRYSDGQAHDWTPTPGVVLNPSVQFGEPVVAGTRLPTAVVHGIVTAHDVGTAADRFRISAKQARAAVAFERRLAAVRN